MGAKKIKWKEKGGSLQKEIRKLANVKDPVLTVGILEGSTYEDGMTVAQVAYWMEYGTSSIPARAPFRTAIDRHSEEWGKTVGRYIEEKGLDDENVLVDAFDVLGQVVRDDIRATIDSNLPPPLKEDTIRQKEAALKKGGGPVDSSALGAQSKTLIRTGTLRREINYKVETKGGS